MKTTLLILISLQLILIYFGIIKINNGDFGNGFLCVFANIIFICVNVNTYLKY